MVSFHQALVSTTQREKLLRDGHEFEINLTKKRKREEPLVEGLLGKTVSDKELHLEAPLPSEWQRCLDIKSGEIHYLNTKTQRTTTKDPRISPEPPTYNNMSLDLELNLPCGSAQNFTKNKTIFPSSRLNLFPEDIPFSNNCFGKKIKNSQELSLFPSRSESFENDNHEEDDDKREMITAVCKKCHMLVMMCKSSPSCPNCKFMHPLDPKKPSLFNQSLSLFC